MSTPAKSAEPEALSVSVRRYAEIIRKRLWVVVAIVAVGLTAAVLYTLRLPKIYQAMSTVVIHPQAPRVMGDRGDPVFEIGTGSYWSNQEYYNTQLSVITGFPLARDTVGKKYGDTVFFEKLAPKERFPKLSDSERADLAADLLKGMLAASQAPESRVVAISVRSVDQALAEALANAHLNTYVAHMEGKRGRSSGPVSEYLTSERDTAERALRKAEDELAAYREQHGIVATSLKARQEHLSEEIARYSGLVGDARVKRSELGSQLRRAQALKGEDVLESPVFALVGTEGSIAELRTNYLKERTVLDEVQSQWGPKSDKFQQQQAKVAKLRSALEGEARRAVREIEVKHQAAVASEATI